MIIDELPNVSIGIPFYNSESSLLNAINSVLLQSYQNFELILVDDGSTDSSLQIARSFSDNRIRIFSDGVNKGLANRLNEIISIAKYDYVARMDSDDLMSPFRIETQMYFLLKNTNVDLISTGVISLSDELQPLGKRCVDINHSLTSSNVLNGSTGIVHASIIAKKSFFLENPYDPNLKCSEDTALWISAFCKRSLNALIIPEPLYYYREYGNVTYKKISTAYSEHRRIIFKNYSCFPLSLVLYAVIKSFFKSIIVYFLNLFGCLGTLRDLRVVNNLSKEEFDQVSLDIHKITNAQFDKR